MMKKLIALSIAATLALSLAACNQKEKATAAQPAQFKLTATAEKFEKSDYSLKKGDKVTLVFDSKELLAIEIKGLSVKLDSAAPTKEIVLETPGVFDVIGNVGGGKTIKAKLTVE